MSHTSVNTSPSAPGHSWAPEDIYSPYIKGEEAAQYINPPIPCLQDQLLRNLRVKRAVMEMVVQKKKGKDGKPQRKYTNSEIAAELCLPGYRVLEVQGDMPETTVSRWVNLPTSRNRPTKKNGQACLKPCSSPMVSRS